ncbi:MAG: hypothetical protein M3Q42_10435 [Pseudomonadota bacterium]|nr:hypothetical protein [Pseudomonadota bacterium]
MSNGALSWTNRVLLDTNGVSVGAAQGAFTANAIDAAYPATNATDPDPSLVTQVDYQTAAGAPYESYVEANWTSNLDVRVVAALNVRLASAVVGVRFAVLNAAGSTLETTTQIAYANLVAIPGSTDRFDIFAILSATRSVNRVRFQVQVPASSTDNFEVGYLWAGPGIIWPSGWGVDWSLSGVDASRVVRADGGGYSAYRYPTRKTLSLSKRGMSYVDAMGTLGNSGALSFRQCMLEAGVSSPVIAISSDDDAHTAQTMSAYALISNMPSIDNLGAGKFGTGLVVEQIR